MPAENTRLREQHGATGDGAVSVVMPVYNHERYVEEALESVFAQTVQPMEIIIVDDGSTDRSAAVVRRVCEGRHDVVFWTWANQGAHHALNAAIHRATGEFVAILNSDDRYHPDRLAACLAVMRSHASVNAVATEVELIGDEADAAAKQWYESARGFYRTTQNLPLALCHANFLMSTSNLFVRRSLFQSIGYFSALRYTHDLEFFLRLADERAGFRFIERPLLEYRRHGRNTISESDSDTELERSALLAFSIYRECLLSKTPHHSPHALQPYVDVLGRQGLLEQVEYFLEALVTAADETTATTAVFPAELATLLSRLRVNLSSSTARQDVLGRFATARNHFLQTIPALDRQREIGRLNGILVSKDDALAKQRAEIDRLHDAVTDKDAGLQAQAADIQRLHDVLAGKESAIATQALEINRIHSVVAEKENAVAMQADEIRRLQDAVAEKESAVAMQADEIRRLHGAVAEKENAIATQAADIQRLGEAVAEKERAVEAQRSEIHGIKAVLSEKETAIVAQGAEIPRLHAVLVDKERSIAAHADEIERMNGALAAGNETIAAQKATIEHLQDAVARQDAQMQTQAASAERMSQDLVDSERIARARAEEIRTLGHHLAEKNRILQAQQIEIARMQEMLLAKDAALSRQSEAVRESATAIEKREDEMLALQEQHRRLAIRMGNAEAELAWLRDTPWHKLGDTLHREKLSIRKIGKVFYYSAACVTPERWKPVLRPLALGLRGRRRDTVAAALDVARPPVPVRSPVPARPRVLHVIANFMLGGSSRLVMDLIEGLGGSYEQKVVTSFLPSPPAYPGADVTEFRSPQSPDDVRAFLLDWNPSLVHVHYWGDCDWWWYHIFFGAIASLGCRVIENVNTPVAPYEADFVDRYVYVSDYVRQHFGSAVARGTTIYPGSDFKLFSRNGATQLPRDCVGMVYRLEADKLNQQSIEPFIKVAKRRSRTRILIVGGGTFLETYRRAAREASVEDNFEFTGYVDYPALPQHYERMSAFVAPVWKESFGQVGPFAMSMGIPVVGYNVGGVAEIVDDASLLASPDDSDKLADIVIDLLDDPARCEQIGARNRNRAQALFSVEGMVQAYRALYGEVLVKCEGQRLPGRYDP